MPIALKLIKNIEKKISIAVSISPMISKVWRPCPYTRHVQSPARGPNPALGQILSGPQPSHEIYNARIL